MKAKLTIYFVAALLPTIIYGDKLLLKCSKDVQKIAKKEDRIEGIFQPTSIDVLGRGTYSFTFQGILFPSEREIAMKFTRWEESSADGKCLGAEKEYVMYSYLDAIDSENVERYGIPSVYYYGLWEKHNVIMTGITLLNHNIFDLQKSKRIFENDLNVLIVCRDFILSSKYMHSRGVRHDDIKIENMMIRLNRCYLIDFNLSSKMNERNTAGTLNYASRRAHGYGERYPKDDWESFLYSICRAVGATFKWNGFRQITQTRELKSNTNETIEAIKTIKSRILVKFFVELASHIFDDGGEDRPFYDASNDSKGFPDYNYFYELVNVEIEKLKSPKSEPALFTWLTPSERREAIEDLHKYSMPNITQISHPKDFDFSTMKSPNVTGLTNAAAESSSFGGKSTRKDKQKMFCFGCVSSTDKSI